MPEYKVVLNDPKTGKSVQRETKEENRKPFHGLKLGQKVRGELLDLTGYDNQILSFEIEKTTFGINDDGSINYVKMKLLVSVGKYNVKNLF